MLNENELNRSDFGPGFHWGVSTAAFQIEGGCGDDGKGDSIWDEFTRIRGNIIDGHHAQTACDHYNLFEKDIERIASLGIPNYRFSISWPRIIPDGDGAINMSGIAYYNRVIDTCLKHNIEPWVTLYHWDLPLALEKRGGWTNRSIIDWFTNYTKICLEHFGDRIKNWIVANEPMAFTGAGYFLGIHAPGKRGLKNFLPAVHHAVMAISAAARVIKAQDPKFRIGTTFSCTLIVPYSQNQRDLAAAVRADALINQLFVSPLTGYGYPFQLLSFLQKIKKYILPADEEKMYFKWDFLGIQNYTREVVKHSWFTPYIWANIVAAKKRKVPVTTMGWEIYPDALYHMLRKFNPYLDGGKLLVTESGAAFPDHLTDGQVDDPQRTDFLKANIRSVKKAIDDGVPVDGYFVWTLLDNFEWREGYHPRFGLIFVNFKTQERTVKGSGHWYSNFLKKV